MSVGRLSDKQYSGPFRKKSKALARLPRPVTFESSHSEVLSYSCQESRRRAQGPLPRLQFPSARSFPPPSLQSTLSLHLIHTLFVYSLSRPPCTSLPKSLFTSGSQLFATLLLLCVCLPLLLFCSFLDPLRLYSTSRHSFFTTYALS
jgi:hypothetical protein